LTAHLSACLLFWRPQFEIATTFGAFLDPVADKVMVTTVLVLLSTDPPAPISQAQMAVPVILMCCREVTMSALREWAASASSSAHKVSISLTCMRSKSMHSKYAHALNSLGPMGLFHGGKCQVVGALPLPGVARVTTNWACGMLLLGASSAAGGGLCSAADMLQAASPADRRTAVQL
jgi:hypothetical protein